ncbi:MAG: hypothetical protein H6739_05805 [Alphaproteobacteria bacterium]|nr:hypothetical protein [Alphaproteobacteria bacterium]
MRLTPQELSELTAFFERRFPASDAARLGRAAGVGGGTWFEVVQQAHDAGRLGKLARAAAAERPDDPNLAELIETVGARPGGGRVVAAAAVVLLALAGVGVALWPKGDPPEPPSVVQDAPAPPAEPATPEVEPPAVAAVAPEPAATPVATPEPPAATLEPPARSAPAQPGGAVEGRCGGERGALVGYWYAGAPFEAGQGEVYTVRAGANVREDYPRRDNGWNARSKVRCALQAGDRVRLSHAPLLVDGGKYWVPLHAGDLQER